MLNKDMCRIHQFVDDLIGLTAVNSDFVTQPEGVHKVSDRR